MSRKIKGYTLGAIAAASYGTNLLFTLPLYAEGISPDSVLFFRYLFALPILAIMLKSRGRSFAVSFADILPLAILGIVFAMSSLTLFQSYNYMDAGIASTILFVYPIMVALIMALFFHEKLTIQTVVCLLMAVGGIGLLYKNENGATLSLMGTLLVFASSLSYAIYIVSINQTRLRDMATLKVTFYVILFGWLMFVCRTLAAGGIQTPPADKPWLWCCLVALALMPTAISLLCTTGAIQYIGSTPTAILGALEPVTAVFFGVTVFHESLTPRIILGFILIISAVSIVVAGGNITRHLTRFRKMFPKLKRTKSKE